MLKRFIYIIFAAVIILPFAMPAESKLGDYCQNVYVYSGSNGSDAQRTLYGEKFIFDIRGESGTLKPCYSVQDVIAAFNAQTVFTEEVCGTVNYYLKADLPYAINLYGKTVNLHIAVGDVITVGAPIIFGGY